MSEQHREWCVRAALSCAVAFSWTLSAVPQAAGAEDLAPIAERLGLPADTDREGILAAIDRLQGRRTPDVPAGFEPVLGSSHEAGTFYGYAEALFLRRDSLDESAEWIEQVDDAAFATVALEEDDLDFIFGAGLRTVLGFQLDDATSLELTYLGFVDEGLDATAAAFMDTSLITTDVTLCVSGGLCEGAEFAEVELEHELHSASLMVRRRMSSIGSLSPTLSFGARYVRLEEEFGENLIATLPPTGVPFYSADIENNLVGVQGGLELNQAFGGRAGLKLWGKGGIMANVMELDVDGRAEEFVLGYSLDGDEVGLAFTLDFGVTAVVRLREELTLRFGYEAHLLSGVALAGEQFQLTGDIAGARILDVDVDHDGEVLYHGPFVGLGLAF